MSSLQRVLTAEEAMLLQARWVEIVTSHVLPLQGGRKALSAIADDLDREAEE